MVRDIRELTDSPEAYAEELRRRWGGLLSYRYIGRSYASMDLVPEDNTVTIRRDMRNIAGGLLLAVLGIASPEGGHMSDLEGVPNPVIHPARSSTPAATCAASRWCPRNSSAAVRWATAGRRSSTPINPTACWR
jgi:hypothetical protein